MKRCLAIAIAVLGAFAPAASAATYNLPPTGQDQWYWEIRPPSVGLGGLPSVTGAYPSPGSANIWDTDMFADSNTGGGVPTGPSPVAQALHAAGKYSICYIEAGAQQPEPDSSNFAPADYTNGSNPQTTEMQGFPGEYWYDIRGFANYSAGDSSSLTGAAVNIAAGLARRIDDCAVEGQDAVEPDDLDGYTNPSQTGAPGGGWGLTQADSAGFERWLAYTAHSDGLAVFQKNDPANASIDEPLFDGMIIEECNYNNGPCAGPAGNASPYLDAGKPVLNAEYTQDGESTAEFCSADTASGITGALFDVGLGGKSYEPCAPVGQTSSGGIGGGGGGTGTGGGGTGTGGGGTGTGGGGTGTGGGGTGTGGGGTGTGSSSFGGTSGSASNGTASSSVTLVGSGITAAGRSILRGIPSGKPNSGPGTHGGCVRADSSVREHATGRKHRQNRANASRGRRKSC